MRFAWCGFSEREALSLSLHFEPLSPRDLRKSLQSFDRDGTTVSGYTCPARRKGPGGCLWRLRRGR